MPKFKDLTGKTFGRLTVLRYGGVAVQGRNRFTMWVCRCTCGVEKLVKGTHMTQGDTKSCGCINREMYEKNKRPEGRARAHATVRGYIRHARLRGFDWNLSEEQAIEIMLQNCTYCGIYPMCEPKPGKNANGTFRYNGIDRVDSTLGYLPSNCKPCCIRCNRAKSNMSLTAFVAWIQCMYETIHSDTFFLWGARCK